MFFQRSSLFLIVCLFVCAFSAQAGDSSQSKRRAARLSEISKKTQAAILEFQLEINEFGNNQQEARKNALTKYYNALADKYGRMLALDLAEFEETLSATQAQKAHSRLGQLATLPEGLAQDRASISGYETYLPYKLHSLKVIKTFSLYSALITIPLTALYLGTAQEIPLFYLQSGIAVGITSVAAWNFHRAGRRIEALQNKIAAEGPGEHPDKLRKEYQKELEVAFYSGFSDEMKAEGFDAPSTPPNLSYWLADLRKRLEARFCENLLESK